MKVRNFCDECMNVKIGRKRHTAKRYHIRIRMSRWGGGGVKRKRRIEN